MQLWLRVFFFCILKCIFILQPMPNVLRLAVYGEIGKNIYMLTFSLERSVLFNDALNTFSYGDLASDIW